MPVKAIIETLKGRKSNGLTPMLHHIDKNPRLEEYTKMNVLQNNQKSDANE
jgi:hypothetical protein